jgi:carboxylesterase type B
MAPSISDPMIQMNGLEVLNGALKTNGIPTCNDSGKLNPTPNGSPEKRSVNIRDLEIKGFLSATSGVANFLNVPFARIPARFREATIIDPRKEKGVVDATSYGPRCPQPFDTLHELTSHLYERMSTSSPQSEFSCLNLNIYAPPTGENLPVLVWIHGGAFTYGDGSCEFGIYETTGEISNQTNNHADGNALVHRSMRIGKPIIVVSLNYRLGYFGFLSSRELLEEARQNGEAGFANQGLNDQRLGLKWVYRSFPRKLLKLTCQVQQNIHFFGGDGFQLTAAGESAGAWSILAHLRSNFPAFQRAFIMSCPTRSGSNHQATFDRLVASTGVPASAPSGDKIAALRSLSPKNLGLLLAGENAMPGWDEKFWVDQDSTLPLEEGPFPSWAKLVVVGMTRSENALFSQLWQTMGADELIRSFRAAFTDSEFAEEVLQAYEINSNSEQPAVVEALVNYTSDCLFAKATYDIASKHGSHPICLYSFDQVDLMEGVFKGASYHSLDNAFLFHLSPVAGQKAPAPWRATADAYSKACIDLVNGEQPWEPYRVGGQIMSFDGERTGLTKDFNYSRWGHLVSSRERTDKFNSGKILLFSAMRAGMALEVLNDQRAR